MDKNKIMKKLESNYGYDFGDDIAQYDWLADFANDVQKVVNKNCNLQNVSVSLLHKKAIEYAKIIHQEEFDDPCFAPDVEQTIRDFKSGFEAAIRFSNER